MPFSNEKKTQNFAEGLSPRNPIPRTPPHLVRQPENETTPMNAPRSGNAGSAYVLNGCGVMTDFQKVLQR